MMRSPKSFVVAVRRPDGSIAVREQEWTTLLPALRFLRWPLFRGAVVLLESMHNGFSALKFSAEQALPESEKANTSKAAEMGNTAMLFIATAMMMVLFIAAPHLATFGLGKLLSLMGGSPTVMDSGKPLFQVVDGVMRLVILVGYILAISRTREAQRLFQYHGAEHKAIWAYETGGLSVDSASKFTTLHPRCGTSFLFVVVFVAVMLHLLLIPLIPRLHPNDLVNQLLLVLVKVPMAFPIAGLAYELQKISAGKDCPRVVQWLVRPGIWMQNITTQEPSRDQLEIAVLALERALAREEGRAVARDGVHVYPSFSVATVPAVSL